MEENKTTNETVEGLAEQTKAEPKTYTEDEVKKLLQAETDRRVSQALDKQKKKYEKEISLSQLDEEQRTQAEKDMKIAELQDQLKEFTILQNKNEVIKVLNARGLNPTFADLIEIGEDVAEAQAKIEQLDKLFKQAVADEIKKRLSSGTPNIGNSAPENEITKEKFQKMTLAQQSALFAENPELFKQLSKK